MLKTSNILNSISNNTNSVLSWYSSTQNNILMRDRFGSLNKFSNWKFSTKYDSIPKLNTMNGTTEEFREIFYKNISHICKKYKIIYVAWSGGVDSTSIICGLINYGFDKRNLYILCTPDSIDEYPLFYERLKNDNFNIKFVNHEYIVNLSKIMKDYEVLLLGTPGDQLFGHKFSYEYNDYVYKKWEEFIIDNVQENYKHILYQIRYMLNEYKLIEHIKSSQALFWWLNFSIKWEYVHLFYPCNKQIYYIFDDYKFQEWCMSRLDILSYRTYTDPLYYKKELKDIIYEVTHDNEYVKNKIKECSYKKIKKYGIVNTFLLQFDTHIQEYHTIDDYFRDLNKYKYE